MPVVVVTDSSARLPDELRRQWGIRQVPLHILLDDTDLRDGVDDIPDNIHDYGHATTAAATPAELAEVYRQALADSGGDGVVAVHLSKALSGTLRRRRGHCGRNRFGGKGSRLEIHRDEHRLRRAGGGAGRRRRRRPGRRRRRRRRGGEPQSRVHRRAPTGQSATQRTHRRRRRLAGHQAVAEAAAAHRRRQTRSGATGSDGQQGGRDDDRPGVRDRRRPAGLDRGASRRQPRRRAEPGRPRWPSGCPDANRRSSPGWARCWPYTSAPGALGVCVELADD